MLWWELNPHKHVAPSVRLCRITIIRTQLGNNYKARVTIMQIDYKFNDKAIQDSIKRLQQLGADMTPITRGIAAVLASESEAAFQKEADPTTGRKWQPLTPKYAAKLAAKGLTGKMLNISKQLMQLSSRISHTINIVYKNTKGNFRFKNPFF